MTKFHLHTYLSMLAIPIATTWISTLVIMTKRAPFSSKGDLDFVPPSALRSIIFKVFILYVSNIIIMLFPILYLLFFSLMHNAFD